jgi:hypothetical protein
MKITWGGEYDTALLVKQVYESAEGRVLIHNAGASLNIMVIRLDRESPAGGIHYNLGRDELICCVDGEVELQLFGDKNECSSSVMSGENQGFIHIPAGVRHRLNSISARSVVLELIGGHFYKGCTVYD